MNGPALLATLSVHAGLWGALSFLPPKPSPPSRASMPVSVLYRKPPPAALPAPAPAPAPPEPKRRRRHHVAPAKVAPPTPKHTAPPLLTGPSPVAALDAVVIPAAPPAAALPVISEAALPEGYVEEKGFTFAPLYRVTRPPRLTSPLRPEYPRRAREFQKEGVVVLEVDIDAQGRVLDARIIEESGWGFGAAALKSVLGAGFAPAFIGETAVPVRYRMPIRFKMDFS